MKLALLFTGALCALSSPSIGQSLPESSAGTLVARWDLDAHDKISGEDWAPGARFMYDESPFSDCVDLEMTTTVGWSSRSHGNGTPDYHCFGRFDASLNDDKYVSWSLSFSDDAVGSLTRFDFDIKSYTGQPNAFQIVWLANGEMQGGVIETFSTEWQEFSVDLSNLQSEIGSTDVFEIQLRAFDWFLADGPPSGDADGYSDRIGLDNISIYGDHVACIPEPGAALLGLMALVPLVLRRRR